MNGRDFEHCRKLTLRYAASISGVFCVAVGWAGCRPNLKMSFRYSAPGCRP